MGEGLRKLSESYENIVTDVRGRGLCWGIEFIDEFTSMVFTLAMIKNGIFADYCGNNKKVIKAVYTKEEIYSGRYLDQGPDLLLLGTPGFNLRANLKVESVTGKPIFTGKHTHDSAFLLLDDQREINTIPDIPLVYNIKDILFQQSLASDDKKTLKARFECAIRRHRHPS